MLPTPYVKCDYQSVYEPSEDSFLLLDGLEQEQAFLQSRFDKTASIVCELGPGSGIITTFLMQNDIPSSSGFNIYLALDISPWALEATLDTQKRNHCEDKCLSVVRSDLAGCLRRNSVDLLVFNPPYVPAEEIPARPPGNEKDSWLEVALLGGKDGMVVTEQVLNQLDVILSGQGVAYILFCARNKPEQVAENMRRQGWTAQLVISRRAGWEILSVYRFSRD